MELVYIEWEDASTVDEAGWVCCDGAPAAEPHVFKQVGFVTDADPWALVLTEAYSADSMAPRTRIPLGMVRRLVPLDPGESDPSQCP